MRVKKDKVTVINPEQMTTSMWNVVEALIQIAHNQMLLDKKLDLLLDKK